MKIGDKVLINSNNPSYVGTIGQISAIDSDNKAALVESPIYKNVNGYWLLTKSSYHWFKFDEIDVCHESIPYDDALRFVEHIQRIKDIYNEGNKEILNYGTLCDLCIEGWELVK